jgi:hypothetical protein
MIRLEGGKYAAYCDGECGTSVKTGLRSFHQAINYISRAEGWDNRKREGQWRNYCPSCGEYANPEQDLAGVHFGRRAIPDFDY